MDLFANLTANAAAIAEKSGLSPDQIEAIRTSLLAASSDGCGYHEAVKTAAAQNSVSVDKIKEVLGNAGLSGDQTMDTEGLFGGLVRRPPRD
jgi:hypothetical protein